MVAHHGGQVVPEEDTEYKNILKQVIFAPTGFESGEGYTEMMAKHENKIKGKIVDRRGIWMSVNKQITPEFTYNDLSDLINQAIRKHGKAFRFNIGFGFVLKNKLTDEYRYYYVSTNHLLFDKATTITTMSDVKDTLKRIHEMNIGDHYYLQRPSSSWIFAGITNVQFKLKYLNVVFG